MSLWTFTIPTIVGTWIVLAVFLFGTGALIRSVFRIKALDLDDAFRCFWLGFPAVLIFLQVWHLWYPIDWYTAAIFGAIGTIGLIQSRREIVALYKSCIQRTSVVFVVFLGAIVVWFADRAIGPITVYDSGSYHLPVIRWSTTYPIVKGLGNINGPLAFNNTSLLYQAMLEVGFWRGRSSHIGNGLLLLVLTLFFLTKTRRMFLEYKIADGTGLYPAVVLTPIMALFPGLANPTTDFPAAIVLFVIAWLLLRFAFYQEVKESSASRQAFHLFVGTTLCAIGISIKLSNVFYAGSACLVFLILWLRRGALPSRYRQLVATVCCLTVLGIGFLWVIRSILLSGYPFFPSFVLPAPVPWRIPRVYAESEGWFIKIFARAPFQDELSGEGLSWISTWITVVLRSAKTDGILPLLLTVVSVTYLLAKWYKRGRIPHPPDVFQLLTWAPILVALPAWFISAPAFRFAFGILWAMAAQAVALTFWALSVQNPKRVCTVLVSISAMPFLILLYHIHLESKQLQGSIAQAAASILWTSPGPDHGLHPVYRSPVVRVVTSYGVTVYQPRELNCAERGIEQEWWRDCVMWDGPLPGTPRIRPNLAYLGPPTPRAGFLIHEPDTLWASRYADEVVRYQRDHKSNIRQLAYHFGVSPEAIRDALARNSDAPTVP